MRENVYTLIELIKKNGDACPDYEKIKELTPEILLDWRDINSFLYCLPECDYDISALEAVLLAVDGDVRRRIEGNGFAKAVLFHLYHDGKYEVLIHDRIVKISAPELKSRQRYNAFLESDCPDHFMHVGDEDIIPNVYTPCAHDYMMFYLFGTNFGYDADEYPVPELEDPSVKNFERATRYMPVFVDYLIKERKLHYFGLTALLCKMEGAGYSDEQITRFLRAWIDVPEQKNIICTDLMHIYLFGKYTYDNVLCGRPTVHKEILFEDKKCFEKAKACLPSYVLWLSEIYSDARINYHEYYDPDAGLKYVLGEMREVGYSDEDVTDFATLWMQEMMKQNKAFYSLMYMRLFGEHFSGTRVNIDGIKNFDAALALIPEYLEYIFAYKGPGDEYYSVFDSDQQLYELVLAMREHSYSEDNVRTFVMRWINAAIANGHPCNSPMYAYLFNQFIFKHEDMKIDLTENIKSFERALEFIPTWLEFLTNESIPGYSPRDIIELVIRMHEAGYSDTEIELLLLKFLEALCNISPSDVQDVKINILIDAETKPWLNRYLPVFDPYLRPRNNW